MELPNIIGMKFQSESEIWYEHGHTALPALIVILSKHSPICDSCPDSIIQLLFRWAGNSGLGLVIALVLRFHGSVTVLMSYCFGFHIPWFSYCFDELVMAMWFVFIAIVEASSITQSVTQTWIITCIARFWTITPTHKKYPQPTYGLDPEKHINAKSQFWQAANPFNMKHGALLHGYKVLVNSWLSTILKVCHDNSVTGHFGRDKVLIDAMLSCTVNMENRWSGFQQILTSAKQLTMFFTLKIFLDI